jgi:hypothetical protein
VLQRATPAALVPAAAASVGAVSHHLQLHHQLKLLVLLQQ